MKKIITIAFFSIIYLSVAKSQVGNNILQSKMDNMLTETGAPMIPIFDLRYEGIKGSRFFNEEYAEGEIWLTNNRHYIAEMQYKFDECENGVQVRFASNKKEIVLFNNEVILFKLKMNNSTVTYIKAKVPSVNDDNRLYQAIYVGKKYQLLKLPSKKLVTHKETGPYQSGANYDKYEENYQYFLKVGEQSFKEIKIKKAAFVKAIATKKITLERIFEEPDYKNNLTDFNIAAILKRIDVE